jgi:hypothetical protein
MPGFAADGDADEGADGAMDGGGDEAGEGEEESEEEESEEEEAPPPPKKMKVKKKDRSAQKVRVGMTTHTCRTGRLYPMAVRRSARCHVMEPAWLGPGQMWHRPHPPGRTRRLWCLQASKREAKAGRERQVVPKRGYAKS